MDSIVTNSTAESGSEKGSAKHGPKLYGGIAALVLVVVGGCSGAPKLSHEAPVSAAAPTPVVTVSSADSAAIAWTNAVSRPILSSQPGGIESAGWRNPYIYRIQGW